MNTFCTNCGHKLTEGIKFCTNCGKPISEATPTSILKEASGAKQPENKIVPPAKPITVSPVAPTPIATPPITKMPRKISKKEKILFVLLIIFGGLGYTGYYFFLQHHPDWDAKKAAQSFCDCKEQESNNHIKKYKDFTFHFDSYSFKTRDEATQKLSEVANVRDPDIEELYNNAKTQYDKFRSLYLNDPSKLQIFDNTYYKQSNSCSNPNAKKISDLLNQAQNKIKAASLSNLESQYSLPSYAESPNGLQYKVIIDNKGAKAKEGEFVKYSSTFRTIKDSLLFSLSKLHVPQYGLVTKLSKKGDPIEMLTFLGKGDSASCLIPAGTLFQNIDIPAPLKKGDIVKLDIKILNILSKEQYDQAMAQNHIDPQEQSIQDYIVKNNLRAQRLSDGMYYIIKKTGTGKQPKNGDKVKVNYTGHLLDGTQFDSSLDSGRNPFEFTIGQGMVIKGWDEGIPLFKVGGKGKLLIPASLGYGHQQSGKIPANSVLIFDIELLGIE